MHVINMLKRESGGFEVLKKIKTMAEVEKHRKIGFARIDEEGKFNSRELCDCCTHEAIRKQLTTLLNIMGYLRE